MSKGHGWLQRRLLDIIECGDKPLYSSTLTMLAFDRDDITDAQWASTRPALRKLSRERRAFPVKRNFSDSISENRWANERVYLREVIPDLQQKVRAFHVFGRARELAQCKSALAPLIERAKELGVEVQSTHDVG